MKKKLSYRDKLIELAYIYDVKEIKEYEKSRKSLTTGQLELILKKNKIIIPKDFKSNFIRDNFIKPISKVKSNIVEFKENQVKAKNKFFRKAENLKHDTKRNINRSLHGVWVSLGKIGLNFLNIIPKLGKVIYAFFGDLFTDIFNSIYNQQLDPKKARNVIIGFFAIVSISTITISAVKYFSDDEAIQKIETKKKEIKKKEVKKEIKKPEVKKEVKKTKEKKETKKPELKVKRKDVNEVILPNLNLKTETVLNLFKDVDYTLSEVRAEKLVKPIYFTQFPRDLETIQSSKLKKETFIQIVLPLIVAENERILEDREKLKVIGEKKFTTDLEKQWLRQKLLEYKVKKGDLKELMTKMDIIPTSIALAQAAKESGWGTSRLPWKVMLFLVSGLGAAKELLHYKEIVIKTIKF